MRFAIPDKLSVVLFAWTCAFLLQPQFNIPVIVLIIVSAFTLRPFKPVSATSRKYFVRFIWYSVLFAFVLVVVNGLLLREGPIRFSLLFLRFYDTGLQYGFAVSVRLVLLSLSVLLFFVSMHVQDLAKYLESIGLPNSIITIILLTLFFLEQLPRHIAQVFTAQEARGAPVRAGIVPRVRTFFLVLSPLVLSSIVESVERGAALELRGYYAVLRTSEKDRPDTTLHPWRYVFLLLSAFIIIHSIALWLSK